MDRRKLMSEDENDPYTDRQSESNGHSFENYAYTSNLGRPSVLNAFRESRRSFDLSSTFDSTQAVLGWENIDVFINKPVGFFDRCLRRDRRTIDFIDKQILHEANGEISAKSLVAILGPRRAGKTTLLNTLSHRKIEHFEVTGTVYVQEEPVGINIRELSAYVEKDDVYVSTLTVREHLLFQACLRMNKNLSREEKRRRVEDVMHEFGLKEWENAQIGTASSSNSIPKGIVKSLSFASELLSNQKFILFADDPTADLDSLSAYSLMKTLQNLARSGYTIICTLDQPSSEIYNLCNKTILMAEGRIMYLGPSCEAVSYFGSIGFPCPSNHNPSDYFIRTLSVIPAERENSFARIKYIYDKYKEIETQPRGESALGPIESFDDLDKRTTFFHANRFAQLVMLMWRCTIMLKRDKSTLLYRTVQVFILGFITGQVYFQLRKDQENVRNFSGLLFFLVLNISFTSFQGVLSTFSVERDIVVRENRIGLYHKSVFFVAKSLVGIPIDSILCIILISIAYWMSGLKETAEAYFVACATALLVCHTSVSFGLLISTATDSISHAIATGPVLILPLLIFGGFFVSNNTIPDSLKWLRYLSWINFGFENLMINQWRHVEKISGCGKTTSRHCLENGREILDFYQLSEDNFKLNFWLLAALCLGYRILAYLFLLKKSRGR